MAAMTLLVMPLIRKPVEEESAAPERGEQLGPHLLDMLERAVTLSAVRVGLWWGYHGHGIRGVGACTPSLGQPSKFPATVTVCCVTGILSWRAFRWYLVYLPAPTGTPVYMSPTSAWTPPTRALAGAESTCTTNMVAWRAYSSVQYDSLKR